MIVKKHMGANKLILSICDKSILGKKFEEDDRILDLTSAYFKGIEMDRKQVVALLKESYSLTAAGEKTIKMLAEEGIIETEETKKIAGIPFVIVVFDSK